MIKKSIITLCFLVSLCSFGQSEAFLEIQILSSDVVAEGTLDQDPFIEWVEKLNNKVEAYLKKEKGDHDFVLMITLHKDKDATIYYSARPAIDQEILDGLANEVNTLDTPRTRYVDFSMMLKVKLNEGCEECDFSPEVIMPEDRELAEFKKLSMIKKRDALQNMIKDEVLPMLASYQTIVDEQFEGVISVGKIVERKAYLETTVDDLTEDNADYWRAVMEMSLGNQIIPFTKACMHLANGEFDRAKRLMFILPYFSEKASLPAALMDGIDAKMEMLSDDLETAINRGIKMHDAGKFDKAVAYYEKLLKDFPNSAWLYYELYFSGSSNSGDVTSGDLWSEAKKDVYGSDPMYGMNPFMTNGRQAYDMIRRQEIGKLFSDRKNLKKDFLSYADIALDLKDYGFAAQMYWLVMSSFKKEELDDRNILAHYLYCVNKLGNATVLEFFESDFVKEFKEIEEERDALMKANPMYQAFGDE
ncbi:MAG: hypothetical protein QNK23_11495 [Crocinitomicaceae bacterium]|nr:hypothetical protein [Crocinitomicaceae bacterium]